jgi:hypothetical protein
MSAIVQHRTWLPLLVLWPLASACQREAPQGGGPLPPVDSSLKAYDSVPHRFEEIAPGVFSRVVYRTAASVSPSIEVRDVELAPNKTAGALTFPGAAVIEVRSGKGSLRLASKSQDVQAGGTFGLSQGDSLQATNKSSQPLSLRVYLIGSAR